MVVAYGLILPPAVLALPRLGCLNIHGSLLPRWRGAAPIQRALLAGDAETGISIMQLDAGLDTGPVLLERRRAIGTHDTAGDLHDALAELGAAALLEAIDGLAAGTLAAARAAGRGRDLRGQDRKIRSAHRLERSRPRSSTGMSAPSIPGRWRRPIFAGEIAARAARARGRPVGAARRARHVVRHRRRRPARGLRRGRARGARAAARRQTSGVGARFRQRRASRRA